MPLENNIALIGDFLEGADYLGTGSSSIDADTERADIHAAWSQVQAELTKLRGALEWSLRHTRGSELLRMVGDLQDTSDVDEYLGAIERAIQAERELLPI
jgi:hypothetical protein